jgi:16S rRNA (guanine527-N7)-methyltransferase
LKRLPSAFRLLSPLRLRVFARKFPVHEEFVNAIRSHQTEFGLDLSNETIERLAGYYDLVQEHNAILHLVAPSSAEDFATRHILESLTLLEFLPANARFADVGTGAGLPSIPCLITREDLRASLIESKEKKAVFLRQAIAQCKLDGRAELIDRQFSEAKRPDVTYVTCRALDRFTQKLPQLLKWSGDSTLLFFGGPALGAELQHLGLQPKRKLMPLSEQRYLFIAKATRKRAASRR